MDMETTRTPIHLWIVGGIATLWNCIGPTDYLMTRLRQDAWIEMEIGRASCRERV